MTPLRRKMREDLQIRSFAPSTQKGYLWRVGQFARHFRRSPDQLGLKEIHQYQVHLVESGVHYGSLQQAVSALRFFYGVTLGKKWVVEKIPYPKKERQLPDIPTREEMSGISCEAHSLEALYWSSEFSSRRSLPRPSCVKELRRVVAGISDGLFPSNERNL